MPIDPGSDPKNSVRAHVEEVSDEHGDYDRVCAEIVIDRATWNSIRSGLKADMESFLGWINDTIPA